MLLMLAAGFAHASDADLSCEEEAGPELAAVYVEHCLDVSPATRPPCNAENSCELIQGEIARGCALLESDSPELVPDYCAEYMQSE
jgi:hypothetical protein